MPSPITVPVLDASSPAFTQALDAVRPELERLTPSELRPINLEIPAAVATVLGAEPEVRRMRPAIAAKFGEADAQLVDRLELVARAAAQAHGEHLVFARGTDLEPLSRTVVEARQLLLTDAQSLVNRGLLDASYLAELKGGQAYRNQCLDVIQLVAAFRADWPRVEGHTPIRREDLDRSEALANQFCTAVGKREQAESGTSPAAELRQRAYTLLVRTYDEVRRMVSYLRWHERDVDQIAPSLWAGRGGRKHGESRSETEPTSAGLTSSNAIAPGMPGSSPFISE